jgi:hypothetical protein
VKNYQKGDAVYYDGQSAEVTRARGGNALSVRLCSTGEIIDVTAEQARVEKRDSSPPLWPFEDDGDPD